MSYLIKKIEIELSIRRILNDRAQVSEHGEHHDKVLQNVDVTPLADELVDYITQLIQQINVKII